MGIVANMMLVITLALWITTPIPIPAEDVSARAKDAVAAWLAAQKAQGRVLEELASGPVAGGGPTGGLVSTFLDRTGGCVRGWSRVIATVAPGEKTPSVEVANHLGARCEEPATPLDLLLRLDDAIRREDWRTAGALVPDGVHFPIALNRAGKRTRKTWNGDQVLAGKVPFPRCDPLADVPECDPPRESGRVTCRCKHPAHELEVDFQLDAYGPGQPQLVSIRETVP